MKSGLKQGRRAAQMVEAIRDGANTSRALADIFKAPIGNISPELARLEFMGLIRRAGGRPAKSTGGRPCTRWRAVEQ